MALVISLGEKLASRKTGSEKAEFPASKQISTCLIACSHLAIFILILNPGFVSEGQIVPML